MLTELQQSLQTKYPHITFNHEEYTALLPEEKHTEALQEELFADGYYLLSVGGEQNHSIYRFLAKNIDNPAYPMLNLLRPFRKDKRESLVKILAFVFFFSCHCGKKHTCQIWMAQEYLSNKTGLDKRTIGRTMKELQNLGIIACIRLGNNFSRKASAYSVSPLVFITAFTSAPLCNPHLWRLAEESRKSVVIAADSVVHCYNGVCKSTASELFPSTRSHGCKVEWHEECYSRTFCGDAGRVGDVNPNNNEEVAKMSCYSVTSLGGQLDKPLTCLTEAHGHPHVDVMVTIGEAVHEQKKAKDTFSCVSVYEHSLDFSNILIGPQICSIEKAFESSA